MVHSAVHSDLHGPYMGRFRFTNPSDAFRKRNSMCPQEWQNIDHESLITGLDRLQAHPYPATSKSEDKWLAVAKVNGITVVCKTKYDTRREANVAAIEKAFELLESASNDHRKENKG